MKKQYVRAMTIAGFDGSGGAGIQADLKVFSALGCYGMTVLTAMPIQNTQGVTRIYEIPPRSVGEQIEANLSDVGADVVKIGMVYSVAIIEEIVRALKKYMPLKMVLDPVMVAKSGDPLLSKDAVSALIEKLLPMVSVITPNLPEASVLLGRDIKSRDDMERAGRDLAKIGPAVVVKGGHLKDEKAGDCLILSGREPIWFESERTPTKNTHGTGCTFSAAIAAYLARGLPLDQAVAQAKEYITQAIRSGAEYEVGKGNGPVNHFYGAWEEVKIEQLH